MDIVTRANMTTSDCTYFAFERTGARGVSVTHLPSSMVWRFSVEVPKASASSTRSLLPSKTQDTPRSSREIAPIRRTAYQFAVDEARRQGIID